jgi:hypothetical protein
MVTSVMIFPALLDQGDVFISLVRAATALGDEDSSA